MTEHTVLAVVELRLRAQSKSDAVLKVKAANALCFKELTTLASARTVLTKNIPDGGAIPNFIAAIGSASELIERKLKK